MTSFGRDRPRRFILPMTALRVTPISRAIWLQVSPALKWRLSSSTRSESHVTRTVDRTAVARWKDMLVGLAM
jgi:hypothetical protein